jgi:hypothetical protein
MAGIFNGTVPEKRMHLKLSRSERAFHMALYLDGSRYIVYCKQADLLVYISNIMISGRSAL